MTNETVFTCAPFKSPYAPLRCAGTSCKEGPFRLIILTISGNSVVMFAGIKRAYSWNSSITIRGHSVWTLNERALSVATAAGASASFSPFFFSFAVSAAAGSPNTRVTVSSTFSYTLRTNSRKGSTSNSSEGRKLRCRSKITRRHTSAFSSFSARSALVAIASTVLSCGRRCSLCGSLFSISNTRLRTLCSTLSSVCAGTASSTAPKAGRNAERNFGYSDVFTTSIASRTSVTSARRSLGLSLEVSFDACASNWLRFGSRRGRRDARGQREQGTRSGERRKAERRCAGNQVKIADRPKRRGASGGRRRDRATAREGYSRHSRCRGTRSAGESGEHRTSGSRWRERPSFFPPATLQRNLGEPIRPLGSGSAFNRRSASRRTRLSRSTARTCRRNLGRLTTPRVPRDASARVLSARDVLRPTVFGRKFGRTITKPGFRSVTFGLFFIRRNRGSNDSPLASLSP